MAQGSPSGTLTKQAAMNNMRNVVLSLYPGLRSQTYCVPPCVMNKVPRQWHCYHGQPVLVKKRMCTVFGQSDITLPETSTYTKRPPSPQESQIYKHRKTSPDGAMLESMWPEEPHPYDALRAVDEGAIRSDFAQQHVLHCLKKLGERQKETMFIISELKFQNYLGKLTDNAACQFPRPRDLLDKHDRDGDFDIIIIHRLYGILVGEIKSSGLRFEHRKAQSEFAAASVNKRVFARDIKLKKAANQLEKADRVVKHIVGDIAPDLKERKIMILPYVSRKQLEEMLENKEKEFRECVAGPGATAYEAACLCITADDLSGHTSPWDITDSVFERLQAWFQRCMASFVDPALTDDVYLELVARFVGSATAVVVQGNSRPRVCMEVRTAGEAVSHVGEMMAQLVLTPEQLSVLVEAPEMVCLVGPPGTGKTIVLVLIGVYWLLLGHDVHILCCSAYCQAVSNLIRWQILKTYEKLRNPGAKQDARLQIQQLDLYRNYESAKAVVREFQTASKASGGPHLLMDETHFSSGKAIGERCHRLIRDLSSIQGLHLWAATAYDNNIPECLQPVYLTVALRSPPSVLREVKIGLDSTHKIPEYTNDGVPAPSDGPDVKWVIHGGDGHSGEPVDCEACGQNVARVLKHDLHVGVDVAVDLDSFVTSVESSRPPPLHHKDVLVLSRSPNLMGIKTKHHAIDCGFLIGLKEPVVVNGKRHPSIPVCGHGAVRVANLKEVRGLESKIVVCLPGRIDGHDDKKDDVHLEMTDRLWAASRCSSQLIMVVKGKPLETVDTRMSQALT